MTRLRSILLLVLITLQLNAQDDREMQLLRDQISRFGQAEIEFANPGRAALIQVSSRISIYNVYGDLVKATVSVYDTAYMATFPYKFEVINANGRKAVESAQSVEEAKADADQKPQPAKLTYQEKKELAAMEETILVAEEALEPIQAALDAANAAADHVKLVELHAEQQEVQDRVDALYARWGELEGKAA